MNRNNNNSYTARFNELAASIESLNNKVAKLVDTQTRLINILGPLFPQVEVDPYNSDPVIDNAAFEAENRGVADPSNPNLRGDRHIVEVLPEAKRMAEAGKKKGTTPSNLFRIIALLKFFMATAENPIHNAPNNDGVLASNYKVLKDLAKQSRQKLLVSRPEFKDCTWKEICDTDSSLKERVVLGLEADAFIKHKLPLHLCVKSWAADRLMFETFRGNDKPNRKRRRESSDEGDNTRNPPFIREDPSRF